MTDLINQINGDKDNLETDLRNLLDTYGPEYLISTLAQICYSKADQSASKGKARNWNNLGLSLDGLDGNLVCF